MDRTKWPAIYGLIIGTVFLTRHVGTSFAFDKPLHSSIVLLASSAFAIFALSKWLPKDGGRTLQGQLYEPVPLEAIGQPRSSREASPNPDDVRYPSSLRKLRIHFIFLVCAICARVAVLWQVVSNVQCSTSSWEPLLPVAFTIWDYWTLHRHQKSVTYEEPPDGSVYDVLAGYVRRFTYGRVFASLLVGFGGLAALATDRAPASTYICAASLHWHWVTPFLQRTGTLLDICIAYFIIQLLSQREARGGRSISLRFASIGWAFLFSAAALIIFGLGYYVHLPGPIERKRFSEMSMVYLWGLTKLDFLACLVVQCGILVVWHIGITIFVLIVTFVSIFTATTAHAWNHMFAFPVVQNGSGLLAISIATLGLMMFLYTEAGSHTKSPALGNGILSLSGRVPSWIYATLLILFCFRLGLWKNSSTDVYYHPIDLLIYDSRTKHETYINQTTRSQTLAEAANNYRQRYGRHPPPAFDHWYNYATTRNSAIIDDFDSIDRDILPFFSLTPAEIRSRTWQLTSNPWHDASGLSIRNGKVDISPNVMPTHRWMLDGLVRMIGSFAEFLPNMDLAFNVNDECRVAVPSNEIERMRKVGRESGDLNVKVDNRFSADTPWQPIPEQPSPSRILREMSWQRMFNEFGNAACPSNSPARQQRHWDVSQLCTTCTSPQSLGAFLANWTLANDMCHQPDMAHLHGMYLSPAAFKATHLLYPIFSQSKVGGFNDLLYPSAWNYVDKALYAPSPEHPDPPFPDKNSSLFWRGATSEGFSTGKSQWKGMTRQRFVHLANNINTPQPILLPFSSPATTKPKFRYTPLPVSDLTRLLPTDVHIVDSILRCGGPDCEDQTAELAPLVPPSDFQSHWAYKYLLDLDGAGFSGRFLPFLSSHSLPLKAALFREWWDDRLTPWQHFVPLDLRGQGFWATLVYFAGLKGEVQGREIVVPAHEIEAERIAEQGRKWAGKVLRKEDMEIYFFRLLLEWGRLTDDRRDEIGFAG